MKVQTALSSKKSCRPINIKVFAQHLAKIVHRLNENGEMINSHGDMESYSVLFQLYNNYYIKQHIDPNYFEYEYTNVTALEASETLIGANTDL